MKNYMNEVFKLPDSDWIILKSPKHNGDPGYWYVINHKHKDYIRETSTYCATLGGVMQQYQCSWCGVEVPKEVSGFRNLMEWSEV